MSATPDKIVQRLRDKIVAGRLRAGERVPDRKTLARQYGTSLATMQRVVDELVDDGFLVVGARKKGTVVASNLPHLSHYTLVFPDRPSERNLFWSAIQQEAKAQAAQNQIRFSFFFGLRGHQDISAYQSLVEDVRRRRVAGLIFALCGDQFEGTPLLDAPTLPRAAIAHSYELPGVPKIDVDYRDFFRKSVEQLVQRGRRRIALIAPNWVEDHDCYRWFLAATKDAGITVPPIWRQCAPTHNEAAVRRLVQLLFHESQSVRPDGLIIADDHLVHDVSLGLRDAGARVGETLDVVGLSNFPHPPQSVVPIIRVGFDVGNILKTLVGYIDQIIAGKTPPILTLEPAIVDHTGDAAR